MDPLELVREAARTRQRAYVPYSSFQVGAAVLVEGGRVFTGCNVESASYGLTICAERAALFAAVAAGHRRVEALAVVSGPGASMCGACRQVLAEFAPPQTPVYLAAADESFRERTLADLLPEAFTPDSLPRPGG
jgi:cytidine deaminase